MVYTNCPPPGPPPSRPKHPNHQLTAAIRRRTEKNADALLLLRCGDANRYVLAFNAGVSLQGSRNVGGFLKFCCDGGVEGGGSQRESAHHKIKHRLNRSKDAFNGPRKGLEFQPLCVFDSR